MPGPETAPPPAASAERDQLIFRELQKLETVSSRTYAWLYEIIAPWLGRSILEVGSGVGVISRYLVARGDPVLLTDYHPTFIAHLRARFGAAPHVACQLLDLTAPHYDLGERRVDSIVCVNVLEHIADDDRVLRGFRELLPPAGRLILQVPNYPRLYGSLDDAYGHVRRYTQQSLRQLVAAAGFRLTWMRNFNPLGIPGWFVSGRILRLRSLNVGALRLYNSLVPLARRLDFLSRHAGLALIACAERD